MENTAWSAAGSALHGNIVNCTPPLTQLPAAKLDAQKEHIDLETSSEMERCCDTCSSESRPPPCRLGHHVSSLLRRDSDQLRTRSETGDRSRMAQTKETSADGLEDFCVEGPGGLWADSGVWTPNTSSIFYTNQNTDESDFIWKHYQTILGGKKLFLNVNGPLWQSSRTCSLFIFNENYKLICCVLLNLKRWKE